jgi:5-methylthioadenosine/S-adenosylhomocysteine deaminase
MTETPLPPADLLLTELTVITVDARMTVIEDAALLVRDGRFAWIGPRADLPVGATARRTLALPGHVACPGFVNVHTHAILSMVRGVAEDLGFAPAYTPGIPHGHDVTPDEAVALARLGACEALLFGSTLINDTYVYADLTLPAMADLGGRVYSCGRIHDADFSLVGDGRWEHRTEIGQATLGAALALAERWHDGFGGRTGVQLSAHAPDTCSDAFLREIAATAAAKGLRVNTHLAQSKTEVAQIQRRSGCTPAQLLEDVGLLNDRLIAAHCIHMDAADIDRCGRAGIHVAHVPKGNATGGTIAPTTALRRAGAHIALGSDNMHADLVEVMRWALAMGRVQDGAVTDFWQPADVLRMATIDGARAMGLDHRIGSIEAGKQADLVVMDFRRPHLVPCENPLGNLVHVAQGRDVAHVFVDGEHVVSEGRPVKADLDRILSDAHSASRALWQRARAA